MTNQVHALFYGSATNNSATLRGLFSTRELAEKKLLDTVLLGATITSARIDLLTVEEPHNPNDPTLYPDVIAALIEQKKIQAIKNLRAHVSGLGLREAKDLVEAVNLDELPEALRVEAEKIVEANRPAPRERYTVVHNTWDWDVIVDDGGDKWARIGNDQYVILPYGWTEGDDLPFKDEWRSVLSEDEIRDTYGIDRGFDLT